MIRAVLMMPGMLLFVIGVWRSREFARWRCWLVMAFLLGMGAAIFGMLMAGVLFAALFYSAFGGYGALMLRKGQIECFVHPTWIYQTLPYLTNLYRTRRDALLEWVYEVSPYVSTVVTISRHGDDDSDDELRVCVRQQPGRG